MRFKLALFLCLVTATCVAQQPQQPDYGKIAAALRSIADEVAKMGPAPTPVPTLPPSPPPSSPALPMLSPARLATFKAMAVNNSDLWKRLKQIADNSKLTPNPNYDDPGLAAAIAYKVTGDKSYADAAWRCLIAYSAMPTAAPIDGVSDAIVEVMVLSAWLKGTGTPEQQTQLANNLTELQLFVIGGTSGGGIPPSNANYCIPLYFGLAITDSLIGSDFLSKTANQSGLLLPLGGLDATGANRSTARNCIKQYVSVMASGGTWPEGPYDAKSVPRLILGWLSLWDILGVDHFPEMALYVQQACDAALLDYAADAQGFYPWGDRTRLGYDYARRLSVYAALQAGAVRLGDQDKSAKITYLIEQVLARLPVNQIENHFWLFYDPSVAAGNRPADPLVNYSPGVGMLRRADGSNLFAAFFPSTIHLNHEQDSLDLFWYAGGENVLARPYGYSLHLAGIDLANQPTGNRYGTNNVTACGLTMMDRSGPLDSFSTADYSYFVGQTGGLVYGPGSNNPSVEWLHELTRTVFFLPASDAIFICDRVNLDDPRQLDLTKYVLPQRQAIQNATHLVEQVWHCPMQPAIASNANGVSLSWKTAGGQSMVITSTSPTGSLAVDVIDESTLWPDVGADQKKWQFRIRPVADRQRNVILTCVQRNPKAVPQPATVGASAAGFTLGDTTVLFGVSQTSRLLDPTTATVGKTYLTGCSGTSPVVVQ